ncbi:MAG: cyclic nucleotide-binding domain-containing protein [Chitinispirillaceae bacterium]|nr:cyclic nucleotide-binding domain-containing protein [Chitinispirillaceae bacterium]
MSDSISILENILVLKKSALFSMVSTSDLRAVAAVITEMKYNAGELIIKEKDIGDSMYLIRSGSVQIVKKKRENSTCILAELHKGECFGEMSAIDEEVRSADVYAKESCILMKLCKDDLFEVILDCPHIGIELLKIFIKRLRDANEIIEKINEKN